MMLHWIYLNSPQHFLGALHIFTDRGARAECLWVETVFQMHTPLYIT